jgi:AraC-like DNA-binding protein
MNRRDDPLEVEFPRKPRDEVATRSLLAEAVVRGVVLQVKRNSRIEISDATAIALVRCGLREASVYERVSSRSVRRQLDKHGMTVTAFVDEVRLRSAEELLSHGFRTDQIATALRFAKPVTFRRFVRRKFGVDVRTLRRELGRTRPGSASVSSKVSFCPLEYRKCNDALAICVERHLDASLSYRITEG